ncbi:MAG: YHYH protein, partial [Bacteroidota bacterium]
PALAGSVTTVTTGRGSPARYFGVAINGVPMAPAPAAPFIFENPTTGEFNWDWVFEPTTNQGIGQELVHLDCSSAHVGPQGYHYHGNMFEFVETEFPGLTTTNMPPADPILVGWASDGFPILYRFGPDGTGGLKELQPGYQIKAGDRPGDGIWGPCGPYNGKYTNDFEFVPGLGDLDECNGIERSVTLTTPQGAETFDYFYVITTAFPQIGRCLKGSPDPSFDGSNNGSTEPMLPLDLLAFSATAKQAELTARLNWTTSNEQNVSHFAIERSSDGQTFEQVGLVGANNEAEQEQFYAFDDLVGLFGTWYYRLKLVDLDGSFTYSPIRTVELSENILAIWVSPNPTSENIFWSLNNSTPLPGKVELFSASGKLLSRTTFTDASDQSGTFFVSEYPAGVYYLSIKITGQQQEVRKVIKL